MKRSGQVGLVAMGAVAFVGTYAATSAYMARPSSAQAAQAAQTCTARPDGTQTCEPARRGWSYHVLPHWSWGAASATPMRTQDVALTGNARPVSAAYQPAARAGTTERGGFGGTARSGTIVASTGG